MRPDEEGALYTEKKSFQNDLEGLLRNASGELIKEPKADMLLNYVIGKSLNSRAKIVEQE